MPAPRDATPSDYADVLRAAARRWAVTLEGTPSSSPSGCIAFGSFAGAQGVRAVVLKVVHEHSDERMSWAALHHYEGRGAVALLAHEGDVSLLERAIPGKELVQLVLDGRDDDATTVLCDVAARLHDRPLPLDALAPFPSIATWGQGFIRHTHSNDACIDAALVRLGASLFEELEHSQSKSVLLHGDLHHFNVLLDEERGWLAIDPKGVVGEPAYEFGASMRNPAGTGFDPKLSASASVLDRRSRIIAERTGIERRRILEWCVAQSVLSAIWSCEDGWSPDHAIAVAHAALSALRVR